ncbi:MAG: hypothetical protein ACK5QX_10455, partial [bacterium]
NELKGVMEKLSAENNLPKPEGKDVEEAYTQLDTNKDGKISPEEQKTMMMGMPKGYPMMPPANKPPATASSAPNSQAPAKPAVKSGQ